MDKLSGLQRMILLALLSPDHLVKTQRERNAELYKVFFDCDTDSDYLPAAQASLSRAYRRLETRGFIKRVQGRWKLTDPSDGFENGWIVALSELALVKKPNTESLPLIEKGDPS